MSNQILSIPTVQSQITKFFGKSKYPLRIAIGIKGDAFFSQEDALRIFKRIPPDSRAESPITKKVISEQELFMLYEKHIDDGAFKEWFYQNVLPDIRKCERLKGRMPNRGSLDASVRESQSKGIATKKRAAQPQQKTTNPTSSVAPQLRYSSGGKTVFSSVKIPFSLFASGEYTDKALDQPRFQLYIIRKADIVCYVGISTTNVWNRWFDGGRSHIQFNIYGEMFGRSTIGREVAMNKELFTIELLTMSDCLSYLGLNVRNHSSYSIHEIEPFMIKKLKPLYNVIYNTVKTA